MRVIPVLDLMGGVVVRGMAGRRHEYRPIESRLSADTSPASLAQAFTQRFSLSELYLADLDAIGGGPSAWPVYELLLKQGLDLWVDAGPRDSAAAAELAEFQVDGRSLAGVIAGLESLDAPQRLAEMLARVGAERLVFSLDLKQEQPLTQAPGWAGRSSLQIGQQALALGVRRMIVLDLARVGVGQGPGAEDLCRRLRAESPDVELIGGGGVRGAADLRRLAVAGCNAALVASALHDGGLSAEEIAQLSAA